MNIKHHLVQKDKCVSVIIPVYKTERYIAECLQSVIDQTYSNIQIIVIDDGSPDNAWKIVEAFMGGDNRIELIRQGNKGLSGARNTGIKRSIGEYLVFLDSDDTLQPNAIEVLLQKAQETQADMVIPDRYLRKNEIDGTKKLHFHFPLESMSHQDPIKFAIETVIAKGRAWRATSVLYRTSLVKTNKILFPVGYTAEDIVFNLSLFAVADTIAIVNYETLIQLNRIGSITNSYRTDYSDVMLFIDEQVRLFLLKTRMDNRDGEIARDSLLCRNIILFIENEISPVNKKAFKSKFNKIRFVLNQVRVREAFENTSVHMPYFQSKVITLYFRLMRFLISKRLYYFSAQLTFVLQKLKHIGN